MERSWQGFGVVSAPASVRGIEIATDNSMLLDPQTIVWMFHIVSESYRPEFSAHPPSAFRTEIAPDDPMRSGHTAMKTNWDFWWIHRYKALIALELSGRFGFFHRTGSPAFGIPVKRQPLPGPGPESHATVVHSIQSKRCSPGGIAPDGTFRRGLFPCAVGPASGLWRYQS